MSTYATSVWSWWLITSSKADETSRNLLTILVPMFILIWFIYLNKKQNKGNAPLPPGPRGLPIVGYLPFLGSNLHHSFRDLASLYGPIFKVKLGAKECVVLTSPSLVKEVVRDHDVVFANRGEPTIASRSVLFGTIMDIGFADYGLEWRKMRKVFVSEMMSNARLDASYHLRKQQMRKMMYGTYKKANEVVDVGEIVFVTTATSVLSMIWGDTMKGKEASIVNAEFRANITEQVELLGKPNISDLFPWLAWCDFQGIERRMKEISRSCGKIFDSAINQHNIEGNNATNDFLGNLLRFNKLNDRATSLTLPQVKNILMDIVVGGTDTTNTMIEWAIAEMLQQPLVLKKVQDELTEIVGLNALVEEVHLPDLKYLDAVVKETLRLHPSLPLLIPHCPSEPSTIGGYSIPKGVKVFLNVYAIQRDPQFWEDPLVFRPERFLNESDAEKIDYFGKYFQYLPFGSGRRICAGIPLAERMSMLVLASLLHAFHWKLPSDTEVDFSEKFGIVVKKAKPLIAIPSPRLSNLELYSYQD